MVDRDELFGIADEILAEGREPSQRAIRQRLARGGSFSDIGPLFVEWSVARGYRPRPRAEDLPQHLRDRLGTMAADIWADGLRNGAIAGQDERDRLVAERDALRLALAEMTAMVGVLETARKAPATGAGRPERTVEETPRRRKDTIAFWDRVMREITDLMEDRSMTPGEIFRLLDDTTATEAPKWTDKKWCPTFLADKMRGRAKEGKFFDEPKPGHFRALRAAALGDFPAGGAAAPALTLAGTAPVSVVATPMPHDVATTLQVAARPSLRRLASLATESQEGDDVPEDLVFSMTDWASDERDARDAASREEPGE